MKYFFLLVIIIGLNSCDKEESITPVINSGLPGVWNLVEFSGGEAGLQCNVAGGEITWTFSNENDLTFSSSPDVNDLCTHNTYGENRTVKFSVLDHNDKKFLLIDNEEIGQLTIQNEKFILDQNFTSNSGWSDGYNMTFVK